MTLRISQASLLLGTAFFFPLGASASAQTAPAPAAAEPAAAQPAPAEPAGAQPTTEPDEYGDDEDQIVITGTRARGSVVGDIPPEDTLDARDVRATGATNISELLDALAPQIGSVQGRGGGSPVLLLNGQRISGFRELRDIPTEAIQRVEILPEEVALKYGYRADQKVVNIVLRQRFRSTVALLGANTATDGGYIGGQGDLTRLIINRTGRTTLNLHAEGNGMLTEAERDILLGEPSPTGNDDDSLAARSLIGTKRDIRGSGTFNRQIGKVSATINGELEHVDGRSLIGLGDTLLEPLARNTSTDSAHLGTVLNGTTKGNWRWTVTGTGDAEQDISRTDRDELGGGRDRTRETTVSGEIKATANGTLFKLPAGNASTTLTLDGNTVHLDSERRSSTASSDNSLSRTTGEAAMNIDLPISRRGKDFSALGNLTLNANAEVDQLSDFGTLTTIGAGANWSPVDRLNFITSWTREEGPPTMSQLGDPLLTTDNTRIFDFTTGQTVLVTATTGGNPDLQSDTRRVFKVGGNWPPFSKVDFRLRADYVHQTIDNPISNLNTSAIVQQAFPDRFHRTGPGCALTPVDFTTCQLDSVNLTPVNFDSSRRDAMRIGFDFSKPLKSRRPSQSVMDQIRAQFQRARGGTPAAAGSSASPSGPPPEGGATTAGGPPSGDGPGGPGGGGRGFGGRGFGGGGGGFFGGNRGRLTFSLTDTITFVDKVTVAPGLPDLDYLHGDAAGQSGGTPRHQVQAQGGWSNNGLGMRLSANWRSGTNVNSLTGDDLHFSPLATFDLRLFAQPGDIPEVALKHPWLRGTQIRLEATNLFNSRPKVHDSTGAVPNNYQPDLLDPLGRTIMFTIRKLFLPPPSFFRRQQEQRAQEQARQPS
jgi:hypothetical protein